MRKIFKPKFGLKYLPLFFSERDLFSFHFQIRLIPFKIICIVRYVPDTPNEFLKPFIFSL